MTSLAELQAELKLDGRYHGRVDGVWGRLTEAAILTALTDGPDTPIGLFDYSQAAARRACPVAHLMAFAEVEASGAGFFAGRPVILFEPHRFSRANGGRYDLDHPTISYRKWGTRPYPVSQDARYDQLLTAIRLDVDAGFASASYGKFQILGENFKACGYRAPHRFAFAMARDEKTQLRAFEEFLSAAGILPYVRLGRWAEAAKRYNGTAYAKNRYDVKLAQAARRIALELERNPA